jgi:hypothetical protein
MALYKVKDILHDGSITPGILPLLILDLGKNPGRRGKGKYRAEQNGGKYPQPG